MKPIKHLYLHFTDGQRLSLRFPRQQDDPAEVPAASVSNWTRPISASRSTATCC